ncbi:MAG: rhodanese-like domain-containing protein, partial [Acidimicrobiia bacterium]|nr:rhodanese-like domain-containing protein [Acidimicrobiia bacterium]
RNLLVIDVRNHGEFALGHLPGARHIPLTELLRTIPDLDPATPIVVNCAGGYRSSIGASLLRSRGFHDVSDLIGGYTAWANSNIPVSLPTIDVDEADRDRTSLRLDCREIDEWNSGHDPRAIHVPMSQLPTRLGEFDTSRRIIVICRSGNRSGKVTAWLTGLGYDAVNMAGGMQAWASRGLEVVDARGAAGTVI